MNPEGFPGWFNYNPTLTGFSSNPTSTENKFFVYANKITVIVMQGGDGSSNSNSFRISTPIELSNSISQQLIVKSGFARNNGSYSSDSDVRLVSGSPDVFIIANNGSISGWDTSGGKRVFFQIAYPF